MSTIAADLPSKDGLGSIGVGEGSVWAVTGPGEDNLSRYSVTTGDLESSIVLPARSKSVLVAFGSVWVAGMDEDKLYRVDPASNRIASMTDLRESPRALAAGEGAVWIYNQGDGTVQRIDTSNGAVLATIETGHPGRGDLDVGGGYIWVSTRLMPIVQIDPRTNAVRGMFRFGPGEYARYVQIRYAGGSLWNSGAALRRIRPPE